MRFVIRDPKKGSSGSSGTAPARSGLKTQYVLRHRLIFLLYIVFAPCPVTGRSAPVKGGVVIPWAWYTSGKLRIDKKSDHTKAAIR
ncbi:TPA: hypothetical protein I9236_003882 [Citrobacter freundii]|nr:hypothetical protein [Citrobacter freundii]HED1336438.1 hypothetical protein [Citrobacter freundii]